MTDALIGKNGGPFRIVARGDCTSRRSVHLNQDLFPKGVEFIQSQKSPAILFLDHLRGISASEAELRDISDVSAMSGSLPAFYVGQADRSILEAENADLIMIDSYADMNFELWQNLDTGWKLWIHPKFLKNPEVFYAKHRKLGRRSFDQSIAEISELCGVLRRKSPNAPVLFLNQQVDYYPKLSGRMEYYDLGRRLSEIVPNSYFGGVIEKDALLLADVGSCGPGLTLHFQAETYRSMLNSALAGGLLKAIRNADSETGAAKVADPEPDRSPRQDNITPDFSLLKARDNSDAKIHPIKAIDFHLHSETCSASCPTHETTSKSLVNYIRIKGTDNPLRWTPAIIDLEAAVDYPSWEQGVKKAYDRVRMKNRSVRAGHIFKEFHPRLFTPDIYEINQSSQTRSGGEIRGTLTKSLSEMGGAPTKYIAPPVSACALHWRKMFGVFLPKPGHLQGDVPVDEQLLAYISVVRYGDLVFYPQIVGHHDFLGEGVVYHCHFKIVEWILSNDRRETEGIKAIMYGGVGNGGPGLWQWKRTSGFTPAHLFEIQ